MDGGIKARPVGRVLRMVVGVALVIEATRHLVGEAELTAVTTGVFLSLFAIYVAVHWVVIRFAGGVNAWLGALIAVTPVVMVYVLSGAPGKLGSVLFVGVSLLFTALRNDAGCEVMTLPGMVFGKRTHLVCLAFSPIDWAESRLRKRETP